MKKIINLLFYTTCAVSLFSACVKDKSLYTEYNQPFYSYAYKSETTQSTVEITIQSSKSINANDLTAEIPALKYNKSWLFMLTQDDCKQAAYCYTWAAINGKPIPTAGLYYSAVQLRAGDLPPGAEPLGNTLGSTDGAGNEVRFTFTTTLVPEMPKMNESITVRPGYLADNGRFKMKSFLVWNDVREMLNYGCGIAFHDVNTTATTSESKILEHLGYAQDSILKHLDGRGCKMLAEPNGNKVYTSAGMQYDPIQTITLQAGGKIIKPYKEGDLHKVLIERVFNDNPEIFKPEIIQMLTQPITERKAICVGVHGTDLKWVNFLKWINDNYGKDGDDSVWFPSQEEYYEYNQYRANGSSSLKVEQVNANTVKLSYTFPSGQYYYFPSVTVNVKGIAKADVSTISSNDAVTGLSYGDFEGNLMLNIDSRKFLGQHAEHFVTKYEADKSNASNKADALYFVNMLKDSSKKTELLNRVK